jgi:pimeloyl-ACP methyl ester carboxylesterase
VKINGVAYLAAGAGRHPTVILCHGLPGNEKNLDLAQAIRRAGWNAITFNYRGSWGSPGEFRFANNLEDTEAVLAFLTDSAHAAKYGVNPRRIVIAGHSMGGWVTALTAAKHPELAGAILISAADMGVIGRVRRDTLITFMAEDLESLAGVTAESMADDLIAGSARWGFDSAAAGLSRMPMLVLSTDDGLAPQTDALVARLRGLGNTRVTAVHHRTDHSWSDRRIALATAVLRWLARQ